MKIAVFASGRGSNLQALIDASASGFIPAEIKLVISDNKNAVALKRAEAARIENIFIDPDKFNTKREYEKDLIELLKEYKIDLIVLAGFMRILTPTLINQYKNKIINIHPSLLPAFKGLNAQKQAIDYGVKYSGCTVHFVDAGVDTGPIIEQAVVKVDDSDSAEDLSKKILKEEHRIYPEVIRDIVNNKIIIEDRKVIRK
ncbi:phosphoribosylglycinamide formyltransferase [Halanaerobiaceae bacterium Z-7014]|uniref:Phosphoribosylglycinamide formyltransferase n=1 Tax=Halonatronomonas betaini TaxID=2778430 RepID=A0A931F7M6_9FIRM|nr:phosphoribosylglycinamide formyltransferase [Halonatronomonas betaini]MBF8436841.1 phosphoribosylglycinamide formyltransferase [Halonatronomonas betaini]